MKELTEMELDFLEMVAGRRENWSDGTKMCWGAAMGSIMGTLKGMELITYPTVKLTDAGREIMDKLRPCQS